MEASSAAIGQRWTPDALRGGTGGSLGAMSLCVFLTFTHPPACPLQALGRTQGPGFSATVFTGTGTCPGEVLQGRSPGAHRLDAEVLGKHWPLVYFRWEAQCRITVLKTRGGFMGLFILAAWTLPGRLALTSSLSHFPWAQRSGSAVWEAPPLAGSSSICRSEPGSLIPFPGCLKVGLRWTPPPDL